MTRTVLMVLLASGAAAATPDAGTTVTVMGSLDKSIIRDVINRNRAQVTACYEKAREKQPTPKGKIAVEFRIAATGSVTTSKVSQSTVANPALEGCVTAAVATWVFPRPVGGGQVVVTYPFLFPPPPPVDAGAR